MKQILSLILVCISLHTTAQKSPIIETKELIPAGVQVTITRGSNLVQGKKVDYTTHTGYLDLKNDTGKLIAKVFFTYYKKDNEDAAKRPVCFTFNGGPGSSYKLINNEYSWLDKTDLVFIDPVATGYSRAAAGESPKQFHGYVEDVQSIASFIRHFLSKYERWGSPKYMAGESYGTTRAAGLSKYLQDSYRIYFNGIFLISPVLNFGTNDYYIGNDLPRALYIPSYTAAAWYHKKLAPALQANLQTALKESEAFALGEYASALIKGQWMSDADKEKIAEKMSYYTGLSKEYCLQANLRVDENRFYKELRRKDGLIIGRLDARFTGRDFDDAGENVSFDPSFINIDGPFTSAINDYFEKDLNFKEDKAYNIFGNVYPWNYNNVQNQFLNVAESLRDAMQKNPALKVYVGSGYYDFATPYFTASYDIEHMFLRPEFKRNIKQYFYTSGHMYYINKPDLIKFKKDVDDFFEWSNTVK
jgi:carboxypeptidase C (cathepsin A)